jgi:hypothetical protein
MPLTFEDQPKKKPVKVVPVIQRVANRFILEILLIVVWVGLIAGYLIYRSVDYILLLAAILMLAGYSYIRLKKEGF